MGAPFNNRRLSIHYKICDAFESAGKWLWKGNPPKNKPLEEAIRSSVRQHVYYQRPEIQKLDYPCIIYKLDDINQGRADNETYLAHYAYQVTIIDEDPDSILRDIFVAIPKCSFVRSFVNDNLWHYIFELYD